MPVLRAASSRRLIVASLLALGTAIAGLPACTYAATLPAPAAAQSPAVGGPTEAVASFETQLLAVMKAGHNTSFLQRFKMLAPVVEKTFDLQTILRHSVGFQWASMPAAQKQRLMAAFRRYTIATWVSNFDSWSGQQFRVSKQLRHVANEVVVPSFLVPQSGSPTNLSFVMKQDHGGWRVVDVLAKGSISRVAVERSDFQSVLASGGVPALMASLQSKISSLSNGALA